MMERAEDFVDVEEFVPGVRVDLRYATAHNAFGTAFYRSGRALLRRGTAGKLALAQARLAPLGLCLKVWDAYRPLSVQAAMWAHLPDEEFVAPPSRGSRHNRGAAVDVTLVTADGDELPMPTDFDDFSERARSDDPSAPAEPRENRDLLRRVMLAAGFRGILAEWWHFDDPEYPRYPIEEVTGHGCRVSVGRITDT